MKQELINILNGLNAVTTNGQSLMILAQCMSQLAQIIDLLPNENIESTEQSKENE